MLPANESNDGNRTAITNATVRSIFLIDPNKKIKMMLTYPMTTGRNFDEIIRVLDSIQLTTKNKVATPANWKKNDEVIIVPAVSDDEAKDLFGDFKDYCDSTSDNMGIPNHNPLGIEIHLESYSWNYSYADAFVILNYTLSLIHI